MRSNMLQTVLNDLNGTSADIEASAIISSDGLMMAALLPNTKLGLVFLDVRRAADAISRILG